MSDVPQLTVTHHPRGRAFKAVLFSAIIFISGGACGWGLAMFGPFHHAPTPGMRPDPPVDQIVRQMSDELLLNKDQSAQLSNVYRKRFAALQAIRAGMMPKFTAEYDGLRADVQKILNPAQFDRWNQRFDAMKSHMMPPPRRGSPGSGPPREEPPGEGPGGPDRGPRDHEQMGHEPPGHGPPPGPHDHDFDVDRP